MELDQNCPIEVAQEMAQEPASVNPWARILDIFGASQKLTHELVAFFSWAILINFSPCVKYFYVWLILKDCDCLKGPLKLNIH